VTADLGAQRHAASVPAPAWNTLARCETARCCS
jgi:hypothetical protein